MSYVELVTGGRETWMAQRDARLKIAWLVVVSLAAVVVDSTVALLILSGLALGVALLLGWSRRTWLVVGGILVAVVWGTMFSQALFLPSRTAHADPDVRSLVFDPGYVFPGLIFYREGALYGLLQSSRIVAMTLAGMTVCLSTSPERLLAALAWLRVPSAVSFMAVAALRFLPTVADQWATVRRSCQLRGYRPRLWQVGRGVWASWGTELTLLVPVVAAALRRASTLATSLTARGYDAGQRRTIFPALTMVGSERIAVIVLIVVGAALAGIKSLYWLAKAGFIPVADSAAWFKLCARLAVRRPKASDAHRSVIAGAGALLSDAVRRQAFRPARLEPVVQPTIASNLAPGRASGGGVRPSVTFTSCPTICARLATVATRTLNSSSSRPIKGSRTRRRAVGPWPLRPRDVFPHRRRLSIARAWPTPTRSH